MGITTTAIEVVMEIPDPFWEELQQKKLISETAPLPHKE
ncbi:hypothetical protein M948_05530 [Virgibacillus sp. CM-4]|nr:hypothetical protein M948_05530 [Virgibacillus sp. CM-4]